MYGKNVFLNTNTWAFLSISTGRPVAIDWSIPKAKYETSTSQATPIIQAEDGKNDVLFKLM